MEKERTTEEKSLLRIRNLNVLTPEGRSLLQNFQIDVNAGDVVLIQGGNGSGKTTLIRCILGVWSYYSGNIELSVTTSEMAYLPQIQAPEVHIPLSIEDVLSISSSVFSKEKVFSVGLLGKEQLSYNWNTASGGEKKRALLTRILLNHPKLIFLDEPFNHLDTTSHNLIGNRLKEFVKSESGTLVLVSHENKSVDIFDDLPVKRVKI